MMSQLSRTEALDQRNKKKLENFLIYSEINFVFLIIIIRRLFATASSLRRAKRSFVVLFGLNRWIFGLALACDD